MKIPVYLMPGMAASSKIFERIVLDEDEFEMYYLEWMLPLEHESLSAYAERMAYKIKHPNPVLIGVSFGGILVQEMKSFINPQKIIIISSVKTREEFPLRMKVAASTKAYKLFPTGWVGNIELLGKFTFGSKVTQRLKLYEQFLSVRDKSYLDWAIESIMLWERTVADPEVFHIHGDQDEVFPSKYLSNFIAVKGGTHIMILNKFKWLNEHLPKIIKGTQ
jgi:hypothetical protein